LLDCKIAFPPNPSHFQQAKNFTAIGGREQYQGCLNGLGWHGMKAWRTETMCQEWRRVPSQFMMNPSGTLFPTSLKGWFLKLTPREP